MKKKTNAQLQTEIKRLERELSETKDARDAYGIKIEDQEKELSKEIKWHIDDKQSIVNRIAAMLDDREIYITSYMGVEQPKASLSGIALKIGELKVYKNEYLDLKDRTLPVPKMKLVEDEHNRNNNRRQ